MTVKLDSGEGQKVLEQFTLRAVRVASEPTNYLILNMLPYNSKKLKDELGLSKMPYYRRLNQLDENGLIIWDKDTAWFRVHNPTEEEITSDFTTAAAARGFKQIKTAITVPAGRSVEVK